MKFNGVIMSYFQNFQNKTNNIARNLRNKLHQHREFELLVLGLLVMIVPPIAVFIMDGMNISFLICLLLVIFGFFPAVVYAAFLLGRYSSAIY